MLYFWILFNVFALGTLILDLRVFNRSAVLSACHALSLALWPSPSRSLGGFVLARTSDGLEFVNGYVGAFAQRR